MTTNQKIAIAFALCLSWTSGFAENDPAADCREAAKTYESGDLTAAIEAAKWCLEGLEQIAQNQRSAAFPAELAGWKRGEVEQQKAMGISNIEVVYTREGKQINVSYSGGGDGSLAAMFNQMSMAGMGRKVRLGRYTGVVMDDGDQSEILISLKKAPGGLSLTSEGTGVDEMIAFAQALPIAEIDH